MILKRINVEEFISDPTFKTPYNKFILSYDNYGTPHSHVLEVSDRLKEEGFTIEAYGTFGRDNEITQLKCYRSALEYIPSTKSIMIEIDNQRDALSLIADLIKFGLDFEVSSKVSTHYSGNTAITLTADLLRIQLVERASREINKTIQIVEL